MNNRINYLPLIISVIVVNAAGFLLRFYDLNSYVIFLGFRFHISLILPFFICIFLSTTFDFKNIFDTKKIKGWWIFLYTILALFVILLAGYLLFKLDLGDPEYFYEFGLSSIIDFPVYLFWNFPQLAALYIVLRHFSDEKMVFVKSFILLLLLFSFEFIPIKEKSFDLISIISFVFIILNAALILVKYKSVYLFVLILFSALWLNLLAFGSDSETLVNLLFARQYNGWEGFFTIDKKVVQYVLPVQFLITLFFLSVHPFSKTRNTK